MPKRAEIRTRIARVAAEATGRSFDHFLSLLGQVEAIGASGDVREAGWRLASYHGSVADGEAIERAVAQVHRSFPFIDL